MKIVFGWYSFLLKSYTAEELNIREENVAVEVRQKCFHVFFIPFFSIGKMYSLRKGKELYQLPIEYIEKIQKVGKIKTSWYAFSGLIILFCTFLYIYSVDEYYRYQRYKGKVELINSKISKINNPTTDDYYGIKSENYDDYILKVENFTKDSVYFKLPELGNRVNIDNDVTHLFMNRYFNNSEVSCRYVWIAKKNLELAIESEPRLSYRYDRVEIPVIAKNTALGINEIVRVKK